MTVIRLRERNAKVFSKPGHVSPRWFVRRIAWRLEALTGGDLSERAKQRKPKLACNADLRVIRPRVFNGRNWRSAP